MSITDALGHDEQSLATHGIAGFGRAEYSCRNAVAQSLQWRDKGRELSACVPRHVLAEDNIRPALIGDADNFGGEEPFSVSSGALPGHGIVLAWIARSEDMNEATPRSSIEGGKVRPDRSWMKPPCFHRRDQACGCCGFPLHVTDAAQSLSAMVESEGDSEFEASNPGTYSHDIHQIPQTLRS